MLKAGLIFLSLFGLVGFAHADSIIEAYTQEMTIGLELLKQKHTLESSDASIYIDFIAQQTGARLYDIRQYTDSANDLHILILDLHNTSPSDTSLLISDIYEILDSIDTTFDEREVAAYILSTSSKQYQNYIINNNPESLLIAISLAESSQSYVNRINLDSRSLLEFNSFYSQLAESLTNEYDSDLAEKLFVSLQRDISNTQVSSEDHTVLYQNIRNLYDSVIKSVNDDNYPLAQEYAIEAYLDNFEYLEPSIEALNATLLYELEIDMRENLRQMIKERQHPDMIESLISDILYKLSSTESLIIPVMNVITNEPPILAAMGDSTNEEKNTVKDEVDRIRDLLQQLVTQYENQDYDSAYLSARTAYLESYELIEIPLRSIAPDFTLEVEYQFAELRSLIKERADITQIKNVIIKLQHNLDESETLVIGTGTLAPLIVFTSSFAIIFREGLESVLILGAIMTYLEASRNTRFKPYVIYGVGLALAATAVTWFVASFLIEISGVNRELIEAIAALSATAVLFYVSFWILNKIEHKRWMEFIKAKMWLATSSGGVGVFVMLSFFTVYREGFETVLFYQAMSSFSKYSESYLVLGLIVGLISLIGVYSLMRMLGKRLPLSALFGLTMGVGAYLSVAFFGNAIRELQILDIIPYTSMMGIIPRLDINIASLTGIYPTLETVLGQIILLAIYLVGVVYVLILRPRKDRRLALMRVSRRDDTAKS